MARNNLRPGGRTRILAAVLASSAAMAPLASAQSCGEAFTPIAEVQGVGAVSPLVGQNVTVEGVVAGDFTGVSRLSGFYLMSAADETDDRPASSEGLFIYLGGRAAKAVDPGQLAGRRVRVAGRVKEYHGLTELTQVRMTDCGAARRLTAKRLHWPLTAPVNAPNQEGMGSLERLESLEGMLLEVPELRILDQRQLTRYGTLAVAPERVFVPTQLNPPRPGFNGTHSNVWPILLLDDGSNKTYPPKPYELDDSSAKGTGPGRPLRLGDRLRPFTAILDFRYGQWRLQPVPDQQTGNMSGSDTVRIVPANDRPKPPLKAAKALRLASVNLQNFFNGDGQGGGFPTARGAATAAEYRRQKAALVQALSLLKADLIAVAEIENDGFGRDSAIADLARALGQEWLFVDFAEGLGPPASGRGAISNGILYRPQRLTLSGNVAANDRGALARGSRPALAAAFRPAGADNGQGALVVVANHLKSKRCGRARGEDADQGDGQGCWAALRTQAVAELLVWLDTDPTASNPAGAVLLGDFNSYRQEDSLQVLKAAGYHNPAALDAYSYVYNGQLGTLDYSWVSASLKSAVLGAGTWPGNVDESRSGPDSDLGASPWGSSDHDPVWVDLRMPWR